MVDSEEGVRWLGVTINDQHVMPHSNMHLKYTTFLLESSGQATEELYHRPMGSRDGDLDQAQWGVFADWKTTPHVTFITTGGQVKSLDARFQVQTIIGETQGYDYSDRSFSRLLGIDVDAEQHIYLADHESRSFLKFDGQHLDVIAESGWSWAATGINHHGNNIYLLEYNRWPWSDAVRVRLMDEQGQITTLGMNHQ